MRLDKFVSQSAEITRSHAKKLIASRRIKVNLQVVSDSAHKIKDTDSVRLDDKTIQLSGYRYILLNKPAGYICSTQDEEYPSALNLIDVSNKSKLHFAGRLDQDTTGLTLISDDGNWTHRITSPRKKCGKTYRVWLSEVIDSATIELLQNGVLLKNETKETLPASVSIVTNKEVLLTIFEGKYHQVKRMFAAMGNRVTKLHRESVGEIALGTLEPGQYRLLSDVERDAF